MKHGSTKYKVLIVDDHPLIRLGLRLIIDNEADMEVCGEAGGVREALTIKNTSPPDIAIIDIALPDGNGLDLINKLHWWRPGMCIAALSMYDDALFADRALEQGATLYLNKREPIESVIPRIRRALANEYVAEHAKARHVYSPATAQELPFISINIELLSSRELQIFESIGRGKKNKEMAEDLSLSIKTIEAHRSNIKKKLQLKSCAELNRLAVLWFIEAL